MKAAILGIAHWHAPRYVQFLRDLGFDIVAVWDHDDGAARRIAAEMGSPAVPRFEDAASAAGLDMAVVLPRPCEAPAVMAAVIESGVPAIAEKPLGLRADDVRPLAELADRRGAFVNVAFTNRVSPMWQQLADAGDIISAEFRINNGPYQRYVAWGSPWMLDPAQAGGGCLRNLGIHGADAVCQLAAGQEIEVLAAALTRPADGPHIETHAIALVRFGRAHAVLESGYTHPRENGGDAETRVSTERLYLKESRGGISVASAAGETELPTEPGSDRYDMLVRRAWSNIKAGRPPLADIWDCYRAARLVDAIYDTAARTELG